MSNNVVDFLKSKSKVASFVAFTSAYWYLLG
jgi:Mitochondrial carrier protein